MRGFAACSIGLALFVASAAAAAPPGFAFLEVPAGARAAALGGAYASLASGADAVFWNPAGIAGMRRLEVAGGHAELFEKLRHDYFTLGGPMWGGAMSGSIRALYTEPIDERDEFGNLVGSFGAHDLELALGYARTLTGGLSLGGTASVIRERISNLSAQTYAFGFGAGWTPERWSGLRVAVTAQNLGPSASYEIDGIKGEPVSLPAAVQTGVSYTTAVGSRLHLAGAVEGRGTMGRTGLGMVGAELTDASGAALRIGTRVNDDVSSVSFGAGFVQRGYALDYAFVPLRDDLGDTQRFAFRITF
jgi:hypothetical protein